MEGGSLFNPGFLGSSFHWFIGQIADDSTWRENQNPAKFDKVEDIPAWGYRYKVRIVGQHEQEESDVSAEELPWAQVMYPVTAGNGIGGSFMTPALKQGNVCFGFFLDGKDEQTPIIMGCLGNNAKTKLERKMGTEGSGGKNFVPQSFYSIQQEVSEQKIGFLRMEILHQNKQEMKHIIHHQIQMYPQKHQTQIIYIRFLTKEQVMY